MGHDLCVVSYLGRKNQKEHVFDKAGFSLASMGGI